MNMVCFNLPESLSQDADIRQMEDAENLKTVVDKLASLRSQGWGTPLYINMEISWPSRHSLYDTQVNATNLSVTDKRSANEICFKGIGLQSLSLNSEDGG